MIRRINKKINFSLTKKLKTSKNGGFPHIKQAIFFNLFVRVKKKRLEFILETIFTLVVLLFGSGLVAGILAGMLGVGGGIILVPVIYYILPLMGQNGDYIMHMAVGTSLATIIPTSIVSTLSHNRKGAVDWLTFRKIALYVVFGVLLGTFSADMVKGHVLTMIFAFIALLVALRLLWVKKEQKALIAEEDDIPQTSRSKTSRVEKVSGMMIGFFSALMGIGGGSFSVPILTGRGFSIHRAVGTSSAIGFLIAVPGTLGFMVAGRDVPVLPQYSLGYVNLLVFTLIVPATMIASPWGVRIAHKMSPVILRRSFGLILLIISIRMMINSFPA